MTNITIYLAFIILLPNSRNFIRLAAAEFDLAAILLHIEISSTVNFVFFLEFSVIPPNYQYNTIESQP